MLKAPTQKHKLLGIFSALRVYNILLLLVAQYLAAIFVFTVDKSLETVLLDCHLHCVVIATVFTVSAGYIINDFYDAPIDAINKPIKTQIGNWVSNKTKWKVYFLFNFVAFGLSALVSWRAVVFFSSYIFLIWLYSHKLQKNPIIRVLSISILDVLPFFVIFVYYDNISEFILLHGAFLFGLILSKEIVKDLEKTKGALLKERQTLVIKYELKQVKLFLYVILFVTTAPVYRILHFPEIGLMKYYFYLFALNLPFIIYYIFKSRSFKNYLFLHNMLKFLLVIGVFSLSLIDTSVLLIRFLNRVSLL